MKKILLVLAFLPLVSALMFSLRPKIIWAVCVGPDPGDTMEILQQKTTDCNRDLGVITNSLKPHEQKMTELQKDIDAIEANIAQLTKQIGIKKAEIAKDEGKLAERQQILDSRIREFYKKDWQSGLEYMLVTFFSSDSVGEALSELAYRQNLIDREKKNITSLVLEISDLAEAKRKLEETQTWLATEKANLEVTLAPIKKLVNEAKAYQKQLSMTVGQLSARQQELIAAKIGSLGLSRSAGMTMACADDRKIDPGFGTGFAFYTFGIPHRVGMNQFGAFGRANASQNYDQILRAYYNFDGYQTFDQNTQIKVNDGNNVNQGNIIWTGGLEDYLKQIWEVPENWPSAALEAQVIAARSYVLAATDNGKNSICANQYCQVFKKDNFKGGGWPQAITDTQEGGRGKVMVRGGSPIKAWFSSTDGGYTLTSEEYGWSPTSWTKHTRDTNGDINDINDLFGKAYDRDSPCFYNAQGWRKDYKNSAWLKPEEVADIVNVILVSSSTGDWDTWDADRVKRELGGRAFNRVDSVSMRFDLNSGTTTRVYISGDGKSVDFDGHTFKEYFNVRAPANIAIVGPLFNIQTR